jgi:hypothetical protein
MKISVVGIKYFLVCILSVGVLSAALAPTVAHAADGDASCEDASFLGFPAWYNGLAEQKGGSCEILSPNELGKKAGKEDEGLSIFIWTIVFNVVEMILRAAGYAAVAFIIYGGYRYMTSAGSADGMASAKRTITNAVIGLVISIAAVAIVRTVSGGLGL